MGKSSINGPFSMAMLNNQMVQFEVSLLTPPLGDLLWRSLHRRRPQAKAGEMTVNDVLMTVGIPRGWAQRLVTGAWYPFSAPKRVPESMVKTIINHPFANDLYHLFMVIWGMVHSCFNHIILHDFCPAYLPYLMVIYHI